MIEGACLMSFRKYIIIMSHVTIIMYSQHRFYHFLMFFFSTFEVTDCRRGAFHIHLK